MTTPGPRPVPSLARVSLLLLACAVTCPEVGHADTKPTKVEINAAKRHYEAGALFYEKGDYKASGEEFQRAYDLSHLPDLLFNLSRVAERLGHREEAVGYLEKYLQERPTAPDRPDIEKKIEALRQEDRDAKGRVPEQTPPDTGPAVGVTPEVKTTPEPIVQKLPPPEKPWRYPPKPALGLMGGGVAFLIIGFGLGGGAISTARAVEAGPTYDPSLDSKGKALNAAAISFDVIGALALAGGGTWTAWWYVHRKKEPTANLHLVPQGRGLGLVGSF